MATYPLCRNASLWENVSLPEPLYTNPANLNVMQRRLKTFTNWPSKAPDMRYDLAKDGFYYTGVRDVVKCYLCGGQLSGWSRRDNPTVRHRKLSPRCLMVYDPDETVNVPYHPDLRNDHLSPCPTPIVTSSSDGIETQRLPEGLETDGVTFRPKKTREEKKEMIAKKDKQKQCLAAMRNARLLGFKEEDVVKAVKNIMDKKVDVTSDSLLDELHAEQEHEDDNLVKDMENIPLSRKEESSEPSADDERSSSSDEDRVRKQSLVEKEKKHLQKLIAKDMCRICHKSRALTLVLPCAHKVTCETCTETISKCTLCDKIIKGTKQVFYA